MLGISLLLAVIFGLASRPALGHLSWGFKVTAAWVMWVWQSLFGVNMVGHAQANGTLAIGGVGANGNVSAAASLGAIPLTLTVITLAVAAVSFRRATAQYSSVVSALLLGVRAALLTALPLLVVSLLVALNDHDLVSVVSARSGQSDAFNSVVTQWQAVGSDRSASLTLSSTQAFAVSFALLLTVFAATLLCRTDWFVGRFWGSVQRWLVAPSRATGRLAIAVVLGGLVVELVTWLVRWNTAWPASSFGGRGKPPHLDASQWLGNFAAAIAYAGNAGLMALGLGSGSEVRLGASGHVSMSGYSLSASPPAAQAQHGLSWWAGPDHLAAGIWIAAVMTPVVLAYVAWSIARMHGDNRRSMASALASWVASLVVVIPLLAFLANLTATGNAQAHGTVLGLFSGSATASGSAGFGLSIALSTATLVVYAAVVAAIMLLRRSSATGSDQPSSQQ